MLPFTSPASHLDDQSGTRLALGIAPTLMGGALLVAVLGAAGYGVIQFFLASPGGASLPGALAALLIVGGSVLALAWLLSIRVAARLGGAAVTGPSRAAAGADPDGASDFASRQISQARLAGILESMQDLIYSVSLDWADTLYMSPAGSRISGVDKAKGGVDFTILRGQVHPDDRGRLAPFMAEVRAQGRAEMRYRLVRPDRTVRWVLERTHLVFDSQGAPSHIDGVVTDITEQLIAELARGEAERVLQLKDQALASSSCGLAIVAVTDEHMERVEYANPAFAAILGYRVEDVVGSDWRCMNSNNPDDEAIRRLRFAMDRREECRVTVQMPRRGGQTPWVEIGLSPVRADGAGPVTHMIAVLNDIDDRVISEARYRSVVDNIKEVVFQANLDGQWTFLNPAWTEITGFSLEESLGRRCLDFVYPDDQAQSKQFIEAMVHNNEEVCHQETRYLTRGGGARWLEAYVRARRDDRGALVGYMGTLTDVTDRHSREEELHLRERALMASANGIVISDMSLPDCPVIYANPGFERITGYSAAEVLGRNCRFLQGDDTEYLEVESLREAIAEERECQVVFKNYRKDGTSFWNELTVSPVRDPVSQRVTHYVGVQNDITERREAEARLFEWFVRLDTIFTLSPDGFVAFDAAGCLIFVNPAFETMVGQDSEELSGLTMEAFDELMHSLCEPGQPYIPMGQVDDGQSETDSRAARRAILTLRLPTPRVLQRSIRHGAGAEASRIIYFRDITRESEVDRMKSEFLSTAAHELRTPMVSIMGFSELLLMRKYDEGRTRDLLETINRQSKRLTNLLNELLDLARIESRQGKDFQIRRQALGPIVQETLANLMMPGDSRVVTVHQPPELPEVVVDGGKIQQALTNILANAYKYSPNGGEIELTVLERQVAGALEVGLQVRDQGMGMTPEQTARAFERFFRADDSGNIPGTGLGLSLVKEIIELHGGQVELTSEFGQGTKITLWLPVAPPLSADVRQEERP